MKAFINPIASLLAGVFDCVHDRSDSYATASGSANDARHLGRVYTKVHVPVIPG
jgi:hypothetical protein